MPRTIPLGPRARIEAYFTACNGGSAKDVASHFTDDAVIWDTNVAPCRGHESIGAMWAKVSKRWRGATWSVDSAVVAADGNTAAIEWTMRGTDGRTGRPFAFHGSEHYAFHNDLISEIRQYWTFDPERLETGLVGWAYPTLAG